MGAIGGPLQGVLPLIVASARSDGHVYTTIRYGRRRMPSYMRITSQDRWDIVNYVRELNHPAGSNR
jgi:mono/diheme cytochrome c family protein